MTKKRSPTRWPNVVRYPDGTYYAFIKPLHGGASKEVSLRTKKAMQVPDALKIAEYRAQLAGFSGSRIYFNDVVDDYLAEKRNGAYVTKKKWKPRTAIENAKIIEKHLRPFFGKKKLTEIDHRVWADYVSRQAVSDYMNHRNLLWNFLKWCVYKNWLPAMPMEFLLPEHKRRPRRILKPHEIRGIVEKSTGLLEIFVHLTLFDGLRDEETRLAEFADVNVARSFLMIPDSKTNEPRAVPLLSYTLNLILAQRKRSKGPYIFPNRRNAKRPASKGWFRKSWKKMLKAANLEGEDITPHDLRATSEKYVSKLTRFTDTEREKMFGSSVEIQNSTYITEFFVDELRGMEAAMLDSEKGVTGLEEILQSKQTALGNDWDESSSKDLRH